MERAERKQVGRGLAVVETEVVNEPVGISTGYNGQARIADFLSRTHHPPQPHFVQEAGEILADPKEGVAALAVLRRNNLLRRIGRGGKDAVRVKSQRRGQAVVRGGDVRPYASRYGTGTQHERNAAGHDVPRIEAKSAGPIGFQAHDIVDRLGPARQILNHAPDDGARTRRSGIGGVHPRL